MRRSIEDILNNKYSEDYEEERRRKEEQDAEWYRQQLQKFREEQAAQGTRQPAANPIEPPRTDPEKRTDMRNIMDQAMPKNHSVQNNWIRCIPSPRSAIIRQCGIRSAF